MQDGGTLIAMGGVGGLAGLCGAKLTGEVSFARPGQGAAAKADSEYNEQFAAVHVLDDVPETAWASGGTPMPHWVEITLSERTEVHALEVVSRQGSYLVTDLDLELPEGNGWRIVKSVRGAKDRTITVRLDRPQSTSRLRVSILRELYEGRDRSYADVEAIRVLDRDGRNRARATIAPVRLVGGLAGALPPSAIAVAPTTAEVVARFDHPGQPPAVLRNRLGKGQAWLVTTTSVPDDRTFWAGLSGLTLGEPAIEVSAEDHERFRFVFTEVRDARVLYVIDAAVPAKGYQPKVVGISLAARCVGPRTGTVLLGSDQTPLFTERGGRVHFTLRPAPVATLIFQRTQ